MVTRVSSIEALSCKCRHGLGCHALTCVTSHPSYPSQPHWHPVAMTTSTATHASPCRPTDTTKTASCVRPPASLRVTGSLAQSQSPLILRRAEGGAVNACDERRRSNSRLRWDRKLRLVSMRVRAPGGRLARPCASRLSISARSLCRRRMSRFTEPTASNRPSRSPAHAHNRAAGPSHALVHKSQPTRHHAARSTARAPVSHLAIR